MAEGHTDREYDTELRLLRGRLVTMSAWVERMVESVVRALVEHDSDLARRMIEQDREVNRLELEIDEMCVRMLALRQPAASDLRFITTAMKIVTDLERIGDLAGNIASRVIDLNLAEDQASPSVDVQTLGTAVRALIRDAMDAFVERDADKAEKLPAVDDQIDELYWQYWRQLMAEAEKPTAHTHRAIELLFIVKHLERIADHAINIAEMVVFMVRGKDIRHPRSRDPDSGN
jgi:phosphate transport system protein